MYFVRLLIRCLALLLYTCCISSHGIDSAQHPLQEKPHSIFFEASSILLPIDHLNTSDLRTYQNRFWFNDTFYKPGGPVFFYDAGEAGVLDSSLETLSSATHPLMSLAKTLRGLAIVWEHRYYGLSLPFPIEVQGTQVERREAYRHLNTEQALEDAVFFASHFEPVGLEQFWKVLKPNAAPWIWIGGSYPGQRAAMIRRRNPNVFFASWSSSANIQVGVSLPEYYLHISHDLPKRCGEIVRQAVRNVDDTLRDGTTLAKYQLRWAIASRWPAEAATFLDRVMFALAAPDMALAGHFQGLIAFDWQFYGMRGRMGTTCASIDSAHPDSAADSVTAFAAVLDAIEANDRYFASHSRPREVFPLDQESWEYQVCTEYFELRTAAPEDPYNVLSSLMTENNIWATGCARRFPWLNRPSDSHLPIPSLYAGWDKNVSNVMFTTGLRDPWHETSMVPSKGLVPGAPIQRIATEEVPPCDELLTGDHVFGLVHEEGGHCSDLIAGSADAQRAIDLFVKALEVWLPLFPCRPSK